MGPYEFCSQSWCQEKECKLLPKDKSFLVMDFKQRRTESDVSFKNVSHRLFLGENDGWDIGGEAVVTVEVRGSGLRLGEQDEGNMRVIYLVSRSSGNWMLKVKGNEKIRVILTFLARMME